jgi:hypothetical protein
MLASAEVVVLFLARVALQARFRNFLRPFVLKGDYLCGIAICRMSLTRTVTTLTPRHFVLPTAYSHKLSMGSRSEGFELILVAILTAFASDVIT